MVTQLFKLSCLYLFRKRVLSIYYMYTTRIGNVRNIKSSKSLLLGFLQYRKRNNTCILYQILFC